MKNQLTFSKTFELFKTNEQLFEMIIKKVVYNYVTQISISAEQLVRCKIILTIYETHQKFSHVVIEKTNNLLFNKQQI